MRKSVRVDTLKPGDQYYWGDQAWTICKEGFDCPAPKGKVFVYCTETHDIVSISLDGTRDIEVPSTTCANVLPGCVFEFAGVRYTKLNGHAGAVDAKFNVHLFQSTTRVEIVDA